MDNTQPFQCITLSVSKKIKGKGIFTFLKRYFLKWTSHTLYGLLQVLIKLSRFKGFTNNFASLDCFALFFVPLYYHIFMQLSSSYFNFFEKVFCTFQLLLYNIFKVLQNFALFSCVVLFVCSFILSCFYVVVNYKFIFFSIYFLAAFLLLFFPDYYIQFVSAFLFYGVYLGFKGLLLL